MTAALTDNNENAALDAVPAERVPAWKKLGLKLKSATDHIDRPTQLEKRKSTPRKRPHDETSQNLPEARCTEPGVKKRPRLDPPNAQSTKSNAAHVKLLSPSLKRDSNGIKKTVSFTSDTKIEDGDSSKSLIADWEAQYDQPSTPSNISKDPNPSRGKISKPKKSRSHPAARKPHIALEYLTQFRESRETWKFNKNREVWILKHLFLVDDIPSAYDLPLSQYLQGLKSVSARSRIRKEAEDIVQKDREQQIEYVVSISSEHGADKIDEVPAEMEDPERRRAYYQDSITRYKRKLEQQLDEAAEEELNWVSPGRLAKRRRAETTLWSIGVNSSSEETTHSSDQSTSRNGSSAIENGLLGVHPQKKKRKNRTCVVEMSSSSSSEDESSDSDSESDNSGGEDTEDTDSESRSTSTTTHSRISMSTKSQQHSDLNDCTEWSASTSSSGSSEEESDPDKENGVVTKGRARSIISISS
jgi:WKF domain